MRPMANDLVEVGESPLTAGQERRLRRVVADGNRGNMLRAVAFASRVGAARWGFGASASTSAWVAETDDGVGGRAFAASRARFSCCWVSA